MEEEEEEEAEEAEAGAEAADASGNIHSFVSAHATKPPKPGESQLQTRYCGICMIRKRLRKDMHVNATAFPSHFHIVEI